jgi:hypothetical protein
MKIHVEILKFVEGLARTLTLEPVPIFSLIESLVAKAHRSANLIEKRNLITCLGE